MNARWMGVSLGAGLLVACAGVDGSRREATKVVGTFDEHGLTADRVQLARHGSRIEGTAFSHPVRLEVEGQQIRGAFRNMPVKLAVAVDATATHVEGEFDGAAAMFQYSPERIEGYLGNCAFLLQKQQEGPYQGARTCGGERPEPVSLAMPAQLARFAETERAAWLSILLSDFTPTRSVAGASFVIRTEEAARARSRCKPPL